MSLHRCCLVSLVFACVACSTVSTRADLVALWRFDQDASPQPDATGNGQSGVLNGDVKWVNDAERGGVMEFDGDQDYLEVEDTDLLSIEGDMTIAVWANFAQFDTWNSIMGKTGLQEDNNHNRPSPYDLYTLQNGDGRLRFYVGDGAADIAFADGLDPPELETWQHIAVTISEDGDVFHYLNGEDNGDGFIGSLRVDADTNLYIGSRADFVTNMFGRLDDVAIFNEVLEPAQVAKIMSGDFSDYGIGGGLVGDFNNNGELDTEDIDLLTVQVNSGAPDLSYDLNADAKVDQADRDVWVVDLRKTWFGDADMNGEFNSGDFVQVFQRGQYEDGVANNSKWGDGDWNGDLEFTSGDFVKAFQDGGYELGVRPAVAAVSAVPEPSTALLLIPALFAANVLRRRRHC